MMDLHKFFVLLHEILPIVPSVIIIKICGDTIAQPEWKSQVVVKLFN